MRDLSGFFPANDDMLSDFARLHLAILPNIAVYALWHNRGESTIVRRHLAADAKLVQLSALNPFFSTSPWVKALRDKRVLVVHPFADSIRSQLPHLQSIHRGRFWPADVQVEVLPAVQSLGGSSHFGTWFDALHLMSRDVCRFEGDVVLIGAGAYSLPLAEAARASGKVGIVAGGGLQLFFGIRGTRWEARPEYLSLMNEYWVRPLPHERPPGANKVENACYW